ncbi:MAG TPA: glycosyltransferase [Patescibacteria group bacterium]|nr:glycosyltransferase [Patescibacteria group bacterium]
MRILFVTATYLPTINGISLSIKLQKDELIARGHKITIIAPKHHGQRKESGVIRLPSLSNPKYPDYPIIVPIPYEDSHFKVLGKKFDVVYFHHPFYLGETAILLAKYFKCPSVFFYHTQYDEYPKTILPKEIPYKPVKKYIINHIKELSSKVDHIVVETPTLKNKLRLFGVKSAISVVTSGRQSMKHMEISKTKLRTMYSLPIDNTIILCVSRLSKEKNLGTLIKIIKDLKTKKKVTLVIAGDGPERSNFEELVAKSNLTNIIFLGNIDYNKLSEIYSLADIFAYPSKTDTQAIVLIEAMSAGLPLVCFDSPGPKDFIINNKNGILCANIGDFKKSLNKLIIDSKLREEMGRTSTLYAKDYSFSVSMDKIEQTLKKVVSEYRSK